MNTELRDPDLARDWLAAGLALVQVGRPGKETLRAATPWIRAFIEGRPDLPPPGVVVDFARLLLQPTIRPKQPTAGPLSRTLRSYTDQVVGRLAIDPLRESASDAVRALPESLQPFGVALFAEQVLDRVQFRASTSIDPGAIRDLDRKTPEEWIVRGMSAIRGQASDTLEASYLDLIACFQRTGRPIEPGDITILEQLELLQLRSERLALRQVVDASAQLAHGLPARMKASRRRAGHISTRLQDDSAYPVGGFSSISNKGAMENLVTSELALMEDGPEVDLFDVRYAEGELLFYTRDETAFVRERRRLTVVLDPSIQALRYRDPGLPFQRIVLVLGFVRALVEQLTHLLNRQEIFLRLVFVDATALEQEARILERALSDFKEAGLCEVVQLDADGLLARIEGDATQAPTDVVWMLHEDRTLPAIDHTWRTIVRAHESPVLDLPFSGTPSLANDPWTAWRDALRLLLADLV